MMKSSARIYLVLLIAVICSCRQTYVPPASSSNGNNLVVEGMINVGADSTLIRLSRTVKLTDTTKLKPELKAVLTVENDAGTTYILTEQGNGHYFAVGHPLPLTNKYRLHIKTADGKEYVSDYVDAKASPPIDSVSWKAFSDKVEIYATTHDPKNATTYYKYDYTDAWEFNAYYLSSLKVANGQLVARNIANDYVYTGWSNTTSSLINLASSAKLGQDVIYQNRVITIPSNSEKLTVRYSILVKQSALTKDAFDFYTNLQKNTEKLGSIFDAQPSVLSGNIHNVKDASDIVVGYLSAGTTTSQRIFITKAQLPSSYNYGNPYGCQMDSLQYYNPLSGIREVDAYFLTQQKMPLYGFSDFKKSGVIVSTFICGDCTLRGTTKKPSYW